MTTRVKTIGFAALVFVGSAATGLAPIADGDIFWHLAAGRELVRTLAPIHHDPFSIGAFGRSWTDVHWLFQLGCYGVHELLGLRGLVLVKCGLIGLSAVLLCAAVPRSARPLTAAIALGSLWCARPLLLLRPVIVSLVLLAWFLLQLERFRRDGRGRWLWLLPLAQVIWCNCQGLFALGPAMVAAYAIAATLWVQFPQRTGFLFAPENPAASAEEQRLRARGLWFACAGTLLASLATPYGLRGLLLPLELLSRLVPHGGNPFRHVAENVPPLQLEQFTTGEFWHLPWFLALLAAALAANGGRIVLSHGLLIGGFVGLALLGNRNVLLLYFIGSPLAAMQLRAATRRLLYGRRHLKFVSRGTAALVFATLLGLVATSAAREPRLDEPTPFHVPVESTREIAAHGGRGSIFCADHYGGYLIWKLYPDFRPFIDTRLILRTPEEFSDYLALAEYPQRFDAFQEQHQFEYVVLPVAFPDRYLALVAHLYQSETWKLVYTDGSEVLFARRDLVQGTGWDLGERATVEHVLASLTARYADPKLLMAAKLQFATLEIAVERFAQAGRVLDPLSSPGARALAARSRLLAGELDAAETLGSQLLQERPSDVKSLALMGQLALRRGQLQRASELVRRAIALDPFDAEATSLLAVLEEQVH
jgi:hypothetical protein